MSCTEAHSRTEWYSWPPVKRFGVGRPIALRIEPSVPPRIGSRTGSMPSARIARSAASTISGMRLEEAAHVRVLRLDVDRRPSRAARRATTSSATRRRSVDVPLEQVVVEVAHDDADRARPASPCISKTWMKPSRPDVVSGVSSGGSAARIRAGQPRAR